MKKVHIVLVEDNEGDILLTTEALNETNLVYRLTILKDGEKALQFFLSDEVLTGKNQPDLILLDMNLPKIDGIEVLKHLKTNDILKEIPVIMLTTSSAPAHVRSAYEEHVNCYIVKPLDMEKFISVVKTIENFWVNVAKLPSLSV